MKRLWIALAAAVLLLTLSGCSSGKAAGMLTAEEAENIALDRAGFTREEVTALRSEYDVDRGIPVYEVEFYHNNREYDCHISAETGEILFWD